MHKGIMAKYESDLENLPIEPLERHNHEKTKRATRRLKKEAKKQRNKVAHQKYLGRSSFG